MIGNFPITFNPPVPLNEDEQDKTKKISYWKDKIRDLSDQKKQPTTLADKPPAEPLPEEKKILEKKGIEEHTKNQAAKVQADRESLDQLIKSSNRCVITISSLFPWDIIPNSINVEESRVTFIFRQMFASQSHSVDVKDISNVFIEHSFFTSSIQIVSQTFIENDTRIENLNKNQAIKTRMIIEGLRTLAKHDIDTSSFSVEELISKIEEMNSSQGEEVNE